MPYQPGTTRRTGAPCSGGIGSSFIRRASNVSGSIALATGRDRAKWLLTKNWDSGVMESDRFSSDVSTLSGSVERIFTPASLARRASRVFCLARARSAIDLAPSDSQWHDRILPRNFRTESGGAAEISWKRWRATPDRWG